MSCPHMDVPWHCHARPRHRGTQMTCKSHSLGVFHPFIALTTMDMAWWHPQEVEVLCPHPNVPHLIGH